MIEKNVYVIVDVNFDDFSQVLDKKDTYDVVGTGNIEAVDNTVHFQHNLEEKIRIYENIIDEEKNKVDIFVLHKN